MHMKMRYFGLNKKGEASHLYTLKNKNGMVLEVSDFGVTIQSLWVPDRNGTLKDVVLGYDTPMEYEGPSGTFFGAAVGRNANRIGKGNFWLNGKEYCLAQNDGENNLHSGYDFYSFRVWKVKDYNANWITFCLTSPDGDQGFPGDLYVEVTYTLTDKNELQIDYEGVSNQDTIINLTNHSYFNLNGHDSGNTLGHEVWIDSDAYTETDAALIPTGKLTPVDGTPMDFRVKKMIGRDIGIDYTALVQGNGYDHNWVLNNGGKLAKVAELSSGVSGIQMDVYTDLPGLQLYTANDVEKELGKRGTIYERYQGVCFETQYFPDAIHHDNFISPVCKAREVYRTRTIYRFR